METIYINTPLGIAKIVGNSDGVSVISVGYEEEISTVIPIELQNAVSQLKDYFERKRTDFDFRLNPQGTEFQQKVWTALLEIPFGKRFLLELSKIRRCKSHKSSSSANGKNHFGY